MTEFAFVIILTFFAGPHDIRVQTQRCYDAHCVGHFERLARESTNLMKFQVFAKGSEERNVISGIPAWAPIREWSPL